MRKLKLTNRQKVLLVVSAVLILIYLLLTGCAHKKANRMYSQQEAKRWENKDMSYAQVSAFLSQKRNMDKEGLGSVRSSLMETLTNDSYAEADGNGRVWIDAYSCETKLDVQREGGSTLNVIAVGVGGEFFQFHPMELLSGNYISDEDLNDDRIVVDENFAWAMFGSNDIVGMQVTINESIYVIAGVVKVDQEKISKIAYGNTNRIYIAYDRLKTSEDGKLPPLTCYEVVYPNPITNYAQNAVKNAFGMQEQMDDELGEEKNPLSFEDIEVVENTNRYKVIPLCSGVKLWKYRRMRTNDVGYPFWENVARQQEDTQMMFLIVRGVLLIFPVICLIGLLHSLWKKKSWTLKGVTIKGIETLAEKRSERREKKKRRKEAEIEDLFE